MASLEALLVTNEGLRIFLKLGRSLWVGFQPIGEGGILSQEGGVVNQGRILAQAGSDAGIGIQEAVKPCQLTASNIAEPPVELLLQSEKGLGFSLSSAAA